MDHIWTPWRFHYVASTLEPGKCVLCQILEEGQEKDQENLILTRQRRTFIVLNRFPYTSGHMMIVPFRHVATLSEADPDELQEIISLARLCEAGLREAYKPDGFNMGFNVGKCAGAGIEGHLHLHVLPRWIGDANVVSVVGQTRVIPEALQTTYDRLLPCFSNR
jgi:ATP adenylyltransferase